MTLSQASQNSDACSNPLLKLDDPRIEVSPENSVQTFQHSKHDFESGSASVSADAEQLRRKDAFPDRSLVGFWAPTQEPSNRTLETPKFRSKRLGV